jgi:hypothetical protein
VDVTSSERDYLYGTPHGRKSFLTNIGAERVAYILCVDTSRPEQYTSMENVQRVLSPVMLDLAPAAIGATRVRMHCCVYARPTAFRNIPPANL